MFCKCTNKGENIWICDNKVLPLLLYFYPSVSASILLDKAFKINSPHVNMIKLRGSWAQVGNDTSVFSLYDDYSTTDYPGGVTLPTASNYPYILPEKTSSWEVGLET